MQKELTSGRLLDASGALAQAGWSTRLMRAYDRADIRASKWRIKEWDYYLIDDGENALCLTIDDNTYMGMLSTTLLNRKTPCVLSEPMRCHDCRSPERICNGFSIFPRPMRGIGKTHVILIDEALGY